MVNPEKSGAPYPVQQTAKTSAEQQKVEEQAKPSEQQTISAKVAETKITLLKQNLKESAPKLSLGEPFANYDNFEACVRANSDKENPEAYCGKMKHDAEETRHVTNEIIAKINEITTWINNYQPPADDKSWESKLSEFTITLQTEVQRLNESIQAIPKDDLAWKDIKPYNDQPIKEALANIPKDEWKQPLKEALDAIPKDNLGWQEIKPYDDTAIKTSIETMNKTLSEKLDQTASKQALTEVTNKIPNITEALKPINEKLTLLDAENKTLKETIASVKAENLQTKETFEKLLSQADKNITTVQKTLEQREKELKETQQKNAELAKTLTETQKKTEETAKTAQEAKTLAENTDDKLKPQFKGKNKQVTENKDTPLTFNPY